MRENKAFQGLVWAAHHQQNKCSFLSSGDFWVSGEFSGQVGLEAVLCSSFPQTSGLQKGARIDDEEKDEMESSDALLQQKER